MENTAPNPLQEKSYLFALHIVKTCQHIMAQRKEFILSKQLLRSGSSIGANIEEAQFAQSRADFISKLSIALKEANESRYWLRLLRDTNHLEAEESQNMLTKAGDIIHMLISSIKTAKSRVQ